MEADAVKLMGRFIGRPQLEHHLSGKRLTYRGMVVAKCFDCMGGYADGAMDCMVANCPLYQAMPYRGRKAIPWSPRPPKSPPPASDGAENDVRH